MQLECHRKRIRAPMSSTIRPIRLTRLHLIKLPVLYSRLVLFGIRPRAALRQLRQSLVFHEYRMLHLAATCTFKRSLRT